MEFETHEITAGHTTLMRQAPMTVAEYLDPVIEMLDARFGKGYAKQHPDLVGTLVTACTQDYTTAYLKLAAQDLRNAITALSEAVREGGSLRHCSNCCPEDER